MPLQVFRPSQERPKNTQNNIHTNNLGLQTKHRDFPSQANSAVSKTQVLTQFVNFLAIFELRPFLVKTSTAYLSVWSFFKEIPAEKLLGACTTSLVSFERPVGADLFSSFSQCHL